MDNFCLFPRQSVKRLRVYKKLEYDVYTQSITVTNNSDENNILYQVNTNPIEKIELKKSKKSTALPILKIDFAEDAR